MLLLLLLLPYCCYDHYYYLHCYCCVITLCRYYCGVVCFIVCRRLRAAPLCPAPRPRAPCPFTFASACYEQPVGEHLKFFLVASAPEGRPITMPWPGSSAPRHLRQIAIAQHRLGRRGATLSRIRFIAYNTRFLILPWVRVEHLASHLLGRMAARISDDWQQMYGHPIYFLETFIDPERFRGTCYIEDNWVMMCRTTGRGKQSNSYIPNRSIKEVLGYPLTKRFRELLGGVA